MDQNKILNRKIVTVSQMSKKEMDARGWYGHPPSILHLDNGVRLFAQCDPEGNGPGVIVVSDQSQYEDII